MFRYSLALVICLPFFANAQTTPGGPSVDPSNSVLVNYATGEWNVDPHKIDSGVILVREVPSGKIVELNLVETAPDSSTFAGLYAISWQNPEQTRIEFYLPPEDVLKQKDGLTKVLAMIKAREIKRKPFLLHRLASGQQQIDIFDTKEQVDAALKTYLIQQQIKSPNIRGQGMGKFPSDDTVDTERIGEAATEQQIMLRNAAERMRIDTAERQLQTDLLAQFQKLNPAQKKDRRAKALAAYDEALVLMSKNQSNEARAKLEQAMAMDPTNANYVYQEAALLYRLEDNNRSIVMFDIAQGPGVNANERNYYLGLNFYHLKEYAQALNYFNKAVESESSIKESAQFYIGLVNYDTKAYDPAQKAFQGVVDDGSDKVLIQRSQSYLALVAHGKQMQAEAAKKWRVTATVGEIYDSNVLLIADSQIDTGQQTQDVGWRSLFSGELRYRPVYNDDEEFALQLNVLTMYTFDSSFEVVQNLRNADPTIFTFTAPWTHKGLLFGKGNKFDIIPGFESTTMSIEDNTEKEIMESYLLNLSDLMVMNDRWFSGLSLEMRQDNNQLESASFQGANDSTAFKAKLSNSHIFLVGPEKTQIVMADAGITYNGALGGNLIYNRLDLDLGYIQPWWWATSANLKFGYFLITYPDDSPSLRIDNSYTLTAGLSKKINDIWTAGLTVAYNINNSNLDADQYTKWTGLLTLSAVNSF